MNCIRNDWTSFPSQLANLPQAIDEVADNNKYLRQLDQLRKVAGWLSSSLPVNVAVVSIQTLMQVSYGHFYIIWEVLIWVFIQYGRKATANLIDFAKYNSRAFIIIRRQPVRSLQQVIN